MKVEPRKGALDHPAAREDLKCMLVLGTQDRLDAEAKVPCNPVRQFTAIRAIDPNLTQVFAEAAQTPQYYSFSENVLNTLVANFLTKSVRSVQNVV